MIRYADVLLMKAEALNSIDDTSNDKYDALNEVRGRAGLTSITAADNLNKEQFAEVVLEERLHELCCEHLRRWDLIRFGKPGRIYERPCRSHHPALSCSIPNSTGSRRCQ